MRVATKRPAAKAKTQKAFGLPAIGSAFEGGTFAALLCTPEGHPYLLIYMGEVGVDVDWAKSAKLQPEGQYRPTTVEGAALRAAGLIKRACWLDEPSGASYAWVQSSSGDQFVSGRSSEFAAVSVRRLFLDSFDPLSTVKRRAAEDVAKLKASAKALVEACEAAELEAA